jgi:hypothetical protein
LDLICAIAKRFYDREPKSKVKKFLIFPMDGYMVSKRDLVIEATQDKGRQPLQVISKRLKNGNNM